MISVVMAHEKMVHSACRVLVAAAGAVGLAVVEPAKAKTPETKQQARESAKIYRKRMGFTSLKWENIWTIMNIWARHGFYFSM